MVFGCQVSLIGDIGVRVRLSWGISWFHLTVTWWGRKICLWMFVVNFQAVFSLAFSDHSRTSISQCTTVILRQTNFSRTIRSNALSIISRIPYFLLYKMTRSGDLEGTWWLYSWVSFLIPSSSPQELGRPPKNCLLKPHRPKAKKNSESNDCLWGSHRYQIGQRTDTRDLLVLLVSLFYFLKLSSEG